MSEKQAGATAIASSSSDQSGQSGNYEHFARRVGIWQMRTGDDSEPRPAKNKGTYQQLVHAQSKTRSEYYATASLINIALFSQIILAAAVTAVSAADGPRIALTVLGALNTVLAGALTWVKGQGLPERLLTYSNELRRVREHIEDLERQYGQKPDFRLDVEEEARKIYAMYDAAREHAEKKTLGTFSTKPRARDSGTKKDDAPISQVDESISPENDPFGPQMVDREIAQPAAARL